MENYLNNFLLIRFTIIWLFISEFYSITFSQQKIVSEYITKIDSLNIILNSDLKKINSSSEDPLKVLVKGMNSDELKHLASVMYKATDLNYTEIMDSAYKRFEERKNKITYQYTLLGTTGKLQMEFKDLLSPVIYALTRVAYFLKIRVENVKAIIPKGEDVIHAETPVIDAVIEEVYKGKGKYKKGDHVQFYYYRFWQRKGSYSFEKNKEYFVPLEPRGNYPQIDTLIALVPYLDDSYGYYPINNGNITDKYGYFGFGENIPYTIFKERLRDKIKDLETW
jgi:hypothetical protein